MHNLNVSETNFNCRDVSHNISKKCCSDIYEEINLFTRQINDNKPVTRITEIPEYYRNTGIPLKNIGIPVKDTY